MPERPSEPEPEADAINPRVALPVPAEHDAALLDTREDIQRLADHLALCSEVALDTEANSMHAYRERTCIMQVTAGGRSAIVDVLAVKDLGPVREALDRSDVEVILHGGDYDVTMLTRDHDFAFHRIFDTMIAATLLGDERVGLANLVRDHFGHELDKRFQRVDWARRPLTAEQLDYLRRDTMYLPALRAHYGERLREADIEEEARIEFSRVAAHRGTHATFDVEGWRRIKGAGRVDAHGRCVLRALHRWREAQAERRDLPPFKVLGPKTMLALAEKPPRRLRDPRDVPILGERERQRHGRALLAVLREAAADLERGDVPARSVGEKPSPAEAREARARRALEDHFKDWRRREAKRRKVPNAVVLPNPAVTWLVRERPTDVTSLSACRDIGPKRAARYGTKLLELLRKA